ncbi:hypothetical protein PROFUN_10985 [Planoprotostelium fungivorum]|uniref:Uncharacterized protein n=1 Tax=Planoprotostelium fungivorum TaxID=1890364 RepID=A0A2P6NBX7_9EUKA|nr:hypothetical protein PROFUN_10985 [Planoprotostelium fungivorum]
MTCDCNVDTLGRDVIVTSEQPLTNSQHNNNCITPPTRAHHQNFHTLYTTKSTNVLASDKTTNVLAFDKTTNTHHQDSSSPEHQNIPITHPNDPHSPFPSKESTTNGF